MNFVNTGTLPTNEYVELQSKSLISSQAAFRQRLKHNVVSWLPVPLRALGSRAPTGSFGVLMYHRVCPHPRGVFPPTYNVQPDNFERQLRWLLEHGYQPRPLSYLIEARRNNQPIAPKTFAVTFDDGYQNNFTYALPILKKLQVPATIFLATAYLDSNRPFPFDNWIDRPNAAIPNDVWQPLTRAQCWSLLESGIIELGCHTHTHADFRNDPAALESDLARCREILQSEFGIQQPAFAYPYGTPDKGFSAKELGAVACKLGCSCALQVGNSLVRPQDSIYHWPRFDVAPRDSGASIAAKLDGWSQWMRGFWRSTRSVVQ